MVKSVHNENLLDSLITFSQVLFWGELSVILKCHVFSKLSFGYSEISIFIFCVEMIVLFLQDTEIHLWVFTEICPAQVADKYHHENKSCQVRLIHHSVWHTLSQVDNCENLKTNSIQCTIQDLFLLLRALLNIFWFQMAPKLKLLCDT